ncbi:MAG: alpha/beta hydrolase [Phycisphaerales bacterium]|nr:alpha/beta hydrolase [Phycisphaerales bacterium]
MMDSRQPWLCAALLAIAAGLGGCSVYPKIVCPPCVTPALGRVQDGHVEIDVMYATDRNFVEGGGIGEGARRAVLAPRLFGIDRSDSLKLGSCMVTIPAAHCRGATETPGLFQPPNKSKHVTLADIAEPFRTEEDFMVALRMRVNPPGEKKKPILVYVPGFATTFEDAAIITGQIAHDVAFDGVPILYSWPTRGSLLSYLVDSVNAEWSTGFLIRFLDKLVEESGAEQIHIIAFSMGSRVATNGIKNYLAQRALRECETNGANGAKAVAASRDEHAGKISADRTDEPPFGQIILAAADMDAQIFERDYAPYLAKAAKRVTVYVSSADWALGGAQRLHLYSRLGQSPLSRVDLQLLLNRIDVVDATEVDHDFFGHFYYAECPAVLEDIQRVLQGYDAEGPERGLQRQFFYRFVGE